MQDPVSIGLACTAGVVALAAGWLMWPRPPALDGERWFKLTLATLFLGEVDATGDGDEAWAERLLRFVPYHPAGRLPERKVVQPMFDPPGERLPGELALQEKLATLEGPAARWQWLYDEDPAGLEARSADPFDLGPVYDPEALVGKDMGWEALARWGAGEVAFLEALVRRLGARFALVEGRPDRLAGPSLAGALEEELDGLLRISWPTGELDEQVEAVRQALVDHAPDKDHRLVVFCEEAGATLLLRALQADAGLRDAVIGVVSVGGVIGGRPGEQGPFGERDAHDWMERWFTLDHFDSELVRLTPFLSVQWLDREAPTPGASGLPLAAQRFPEPRDDEVIATLESVDLGPLEPRSDLPVAQVARALIAVTAMWCLTRA